MIFPIRDMNGGAGRARRPDPRRRRPTTARDHGPKYLNSPATPLFDKSRTLYLIDRAKGPIRKSGQAVIVEGYTDALMAHQAGFDNVVASLGTALTPGQVALLTRYAKKIALAYDVDAAGEKAGTFGVQALESLIGQLAAADTGVELDEVRVVRLPDGKDPDEVVRETPDRWREEVRTAQPIVDYLIDHARPGFDLKTPGGKARFVDAIVPTLRAIPNPVMRDAYLQTIHRVSGVEERIASSRSSTGGPDAGRASRGRITADAVIGAADALPVDRILAAITPGRGGAPAADPARARISSSGRPTRSGPDQLPSTPRPRAVPGDRPPARRRTTGRPPAVLDVGADGRPRRRDPGASPRRSSPGRRRTSRRSAPSGSPTPSTAACSASSGSGSTSGPTGSAPSSSPPRAAATARPSTRLIDLQRQTNESRRAVDRQIEQATVLVRA